jgi:hypothetical protein
VPQPSDCSEDGADLAYSGPPGGLVGYSHTAVWDHLDENDEHYSVNGVVTVDQLKRLEQETDVLMLPNPTGKLVNIGGHSEAAVRKARDKLEVMLAVKVRITLLSLFSFSVVLSDAAASNLLAILVLTNVFRNYRKFRLEQSI